tara:strand:+ start:530 stop:916 length:387 start_codon:yes stop_codon:yes gene_type:complete
MKYLIIFFLFIFLSSCASLTQGTSDAFLITSKPNNVEIMTSHGYFCNAPCALKLPKKESFTVTASKKGYCSRVYTVVSTMGGSGGAAMAGNVLVGGLIGAGVDTMTGAAKRLEPNPLNIELEKCSGEE